MSTAKKVRLNKDEEKLVVSYANLKLKQNRLSKEVDTMKQSVVNLFESKKVNVIFAKDKQDNIFGIQRINRKRKNSILLISKSNILIYSISSQVRLNIMSTKH